MSTQNLLDALTQFCVDHFGAAFARIWLIDAGGKILVLASSRGQYTRLDGTRAKISIGQGSKIDKLFVEQNPHVTNDVLNDPGVKDKEWAKREGFISFAGYPLFWGGEKLGVLGMYSRQVLSNDLLLVMNVFIGLASSVIYQHQQTERNMNHFCQATGFRRALLDQFIELGAERALRKRSPRETKPSE
jgi:GAF domain-containing protein